MSNPAPLMTAVVVGSVNVDLVLRSATLPAPGETVLARSLVRIPGGKGGNQAVALSRLGVRTSIIGCVGDDVDGQWSRMQLAREGVDTSGLISEPSASTGVAVVALDDKGENQILVVPGANYSNPDVFIDAPDVVLAQLEIPIETVRLAMSRGRAAGALTVLNASPVRDLSDELLGDVHILVVNEGEARQMSPGPGGAAHAALRLLERGPRAVVVTLGAEGALAAVGGEVLRVPASKVRDVIDTTGAGDCFVAALAHAWVRGYDVVTGLRYATTAAGLSIQKVGAQSSLPSDAEVTEAMVAVWGPLPQPSASS